MSHRDTRPLGHSIRWFACGLFLLALAHNPTVTAHPPLRITSDGYFKQRPDWNPDGSQCVYAEHRGDRILLQLLNRRTKKIIRLTKHESPEYDAVFSRDGRRLLFSYDRTSPNQGDLEVYLFNREDESVKPVAVTSGGLSHEESPDWSPDGKQLVFASTRHGNQEIYRGGLGGGDWTRLTSDPSLDTHPRWSPDGKWIVFATNRWGDFELARIQPEGTDLTRLTYSSGLDDYADWSPDGKWIAFASNRTRNFEIMIMRPDGSGLRTIAPHRGIDNFPAWVSADTLSWISNRDGGFDIYLQQLTDLE